MSEVMIAVKLVLIMPATNATSEHSFSALRRVKTYLRATMGQERLNHVMLLHIHKARTDVLKTKLIVGGSNTGSECLEGSFRQI